MINDLRPVIICDELGIPQASQARINILGLNVFVIPNCLFFELADERLDEVNGRYTWFVGLP